MPKTLTDHELGEIINQAINGDEIECTDAYMCFLEDLSDLIANHFGGERGEIVCSKSGLDYTVKFSLNECVPPNGGVYRHFDDIVSWKNGKERRG